MDNINEIICHPGAERALLNIICSHPDKLVECESEGIKPDMFTVLANRYIYSTVAFLFMQNMKPDTITILNSIPDDTGKKAIDELGGIEYIDLITNTTVPKENMKLYINQIKDLYMKRQAYLICEKYMDKCKNLDVSSDKVINNIESDILELMLKNSNNQEVKKIGEGLEERLNERLNKPQEVAGYRMGWEQYDKITQGDIPGELEVLIAPSKTGKSIYLLNKAHKRACIDGIGTLYIDTELKKEQQEDRLIALISGVPYQEIRNGMFGRDTENGLARDKMERMKKAANIVKNAPFYHIYLPNFTPEQLYAICKREKLKHNIGYIIMDYIQLSESEVKQLNSAKEYQRLGYLTTTLKNIAGELNVPLSAAGQANRKKEGTADMDESDIQGSYRILQKADKLFFLNNKSEEEVAREGLQYGNQRLKIAFQRSGDGSGKIIDIMNYKNICRMKEV